MKKFHAEVAKNYPGIRLKYNHESGQLIEPKFLDKHPDEVCRWINSWLKLAIAAEVKE